MTRKASDYSVSREAFDYPGNETPWEVWHNPSITGMSSHATRKQAMAAVKRYEAADIRRAAREREEIASYA